MDRTRTGKVAELFVFNNFSRVPVDEVKAGDICAVTGLPNVGIGETLCNTDNIIPLPAISVSPCNLLRGAEIDLCLYID